VSVYVRSSGRGSMRSVFSSSSGLRGLLFSFKPNLTVTLTVTLQFNNRSSQWCKQDQILKNKTKTTGSRRRRRRSGFTSAGRCLYARI